MSNNTEKDFLIKVCKYCINEYQILNSSPIIADFIYQLCKEVNLYVPPAHGTISVEINGLKRQFSHCFNIYNSIIVDASIYGLALINKPLINLLPLYIVGYPPAEIDYHIYSNVKDNTQINFNRSYLKKILSEIDNISNIKIEKFDNLHDSKKKNLFFYK